MKKTEAVSLKPLGAKIGHFTDKTAKTGCTVLLFDSPAVCGVQTRGGAPGTRETALLDPTCLVDRVNGILLTGGSSFGLAAADGVMRYLAERNAGFRVGDDVVPIVPAAVIYDRGVGRKTAPSAADGLKACKKASYSTPATGRMGAGAGAAIGKWSKRLKPDAGGTGIVLKKMGRITVCAVVVVNSFGSVVDPDTGNIVAGARDENGKLHPFRLADADASPMGNTIIGAVITDAGLTASDAERLASVAHDGIAKAVRPSHTLYDGDTLFAVSTGNRRADLNRLVILAADAVQDAVLLAARQKKD